MTLCLWIGWQAETDTNKSAAIGPVVGSVWFFWGGDTYGGVCGVWIYAYTSKEE